MLESETILRRMIDALPRLGQEPISMRQWAARLHGGHYSPLAEKLLRSRYARYKEKGLLGGLIDEEVRQEHGGQRYYFSRADSQAPTDNQIGETAPTLSPPTLKIPTITGRNRLSSFNSIPVHVGPRFIGLKP